MNADDLKDIGEIRRMVQVGNVFDVVLEKLSDERFHLVFQVVGGPRYVLATQKRNDRALMWREFKTSDAALKCIEQLMSKTRKNAVRQVHVRFF